jgi:hypothetical protein
MNRGMQVSSMILPPLGKYLGEDGWLILVVYFLISLGTTRLFLIVTAPIYFLLTVY